MGGRGMARRLLAVGRNLLDYPFVVSGLGYDVWEWRADKSDTLFQDSAGLTPLTETDGVPDDSQPVGRWVDRVQGVAATQATTAAKPTYTTGSLNGLPTLAFDGGDVLVTANITIGTFAVWAVFRNSAGGGRFVYQQSADSVGNPGMALRTSDVATIRVRRGANISAKDFSAGWANDNTWRAVRHTSNGTHVTHLMAINGNNQTLTSSSTANVGTGAATDVLSIGATTIAASGITGNIAHMVIVSTYPTSEIITNMESYINGIWSVY